ncbi:T9SS type A sorting domain-containing protein [Labilibacter sediminis]|nr:T9SS type A sorting domain-containing protein [Labilibacter sediminis]
MKKNFKNRLIFAVLFICCFTYIKAAETKPNIIIIVADDLGNADVGYNNQQSDVATPNIDNLALNGVKFTSGYVTAPVCGPSRAGLLTGVYQQRFGFEDNPGPFRATEDVVPGIPLSQKTVAEYFKPLGYTTACFGKWHVGGEEGDELLPSNRGFDEFYGFLGGASSYFPGDNTDEKLFHNLTPVEMEPDYLTDALARETMEFITSNQSNPFLIYLAFNAVHGPLQAPQEIIDMYAHIEPIQRRKLCAMQHIMDLNIGLVVSKLDELNLSDNTLIFFVSDNGGKYEDNYSYNYPYRGEKGTLYEGGIRLPFLMKWPGHITPNTEYAKAVSALDIVPTALSAAGEDLSTYEAFDGVDLIPYITGSNTNVPHDYMYWKLNSTKWAIRDAQYKLVYSGEGDQPLLFDIEADKSEENDLYDAMPAKAADLLAEFDSWKSGVLPPQWGWQPSIGEYVKHADEEFENVVKLQFKQLGNGIPEVVENPSKTGINTSNNVLKITLSENAQDWAGAWASVPRFQKKKRYAHVKVLKERISPMRFKVEGDNSASYTALNMNDYTTPGVWQDIVFDIDFYSAVTKMNFQPDFMVGSATVVYIDDIWYSDDPTPRGAPFTEYKPIGLSVSEISDTQLTLSWDALTNAVSYKVYKDEVEIAVVSTNSCQVSDLTSDGVYDFKVVGVNASDELSLFSDNYKVMMPDYSYIICDFDTKVESFNQLGTSSFEVVSNPDNSGLNKSANVLKIIRAEGNTVNYSGVWSDVQDFDRQLRYVHMMVYKERISVVRFKLEGSSSLVKESTSAQTKTGEWEDMVFDFNTLNTTVNKINIQPDYTNTGVAQIMYIDDIIMSNSAEPRTVLNTSSGKRISSDDTFNIYPVPVRDVLNISHPEYVEGGITIYNISGKVVLQSNSQSAYSGISIQSLGKGIYFLKCKYNGKIRTAQFVK